MEIVIPHIISIVVSFAAVCFIHPLLVKIAIKKHIVDSPNERKFQDAPVPTMGGIAVFFGIAVSLVCTTVFTGISLPPALIAALFTMLCLGTLDDISDIPPVVRMIVQAVAVLALMFFCGYSLDNLHGLWGLDVIPLAAALPLTLFSVVGIINAMNLIDGVDGLSSGLCILYSTIFGIAFILAGDTAMTVMCLSAIGALIPFFMHNAFGRTSKMYIGNGGTMLMGLMLSVAVMVMVGDETFVTIFDARGYSVVPFTMAVLSIPVFDTLRVMTRRILHGTSPFHADRTHLHHMFIRLGFSHVGTTLRITALNCMVIGIWALSAYLGADTDLQFYIVIAAGTLATAGLYATVEAIERRYPEQTARFIEHNFRTKPKRDSIFLFLQKLMDSI